MQVQELQFAPIDEASRREWYHAQHAVKSNEGKLFVFRVPKASDGVGSVVGVRVTDMDTGIAVAKIPLRNPDNFGFITLEVGRTYEVLSGSNGGMGPDPFTLLECCYPYCSDPVRFTPTREMPIGYVLVKGGKYCAQAVSGFGGCFCGAKVTKNMIVSQEQYLNALAKAGIACKRLRTMNRIHRGLVVANRALGGVPVANVARGNWEGAAIDMEADYAHCVRTDELEYPAMHSDELITPLDITPLHQQHPMTISPPITQSDLHGSIRREAATVKKTTIRRIYHHQVPTMEKTTTSKDGLQPTQDLPDTNLQKPAPIKKKSFSDEASPTILRIHHQVASMEKKVATCKQGRQQRDPDGEKR